MITGALAVWSDGIALVVGFAAYWLSEKSFAWGLGQGGPLPVPRGTSRVTL